MNTDEMSIEEMLEWLSDNCGDYDFFMINVRPHETFFRTVPAVYGDPRTNHRGATLHEALSNAIQTIKG